MAFRQVTILGLGLIGTSLGLALKTAPGKPRVIGFDVDNDMLSRASKLGAIDRACSNIAEACETSDVLILATPVGSILRLLPQIAPHVASGTLVTDTGGTKTRILAAAHECLADPSCFVGGHPMAGRLTAGVAEPSADLYQRTVYCLAVSPSSAPWAVDAAVALAEAVGAQPYFIDAGEHDTLLAGISHLPYLASVALVNAVTSQSSWSEMAALAAGGFRTMSSLVDADERMWAEVTQTNSENVADQLDRLISGLTHLRKLIVSDDPEITADFGRARSYYRAWRYGESPAKAQPTPTESEGSSAGPPAAQSSRWSSLFRRT